MLAAMPDALLRRALDVDERYADRGVFGRADANISAFRRPQMTDSQL